MDPLDSKTLDRLYGNTGERKEVSREWELTTEDLYRAVSEMNPDKAPGPDELRLRLIFHGGGKLSEAIGETMESVCSLDFLIIPVTSENIFAMTMH